MRRRLTWLAGTVAASVLSVSLMACEAPSSSSQPQNDSPKVENSSASSTIVEGSSSQSEKPIGVSINLADNSILTFDGNAGSAKLVEDMQNCIPPTSCTVRYDQMGALPTVTVNDARTIRDVYKKLANMHVEGKTNMSMTDSYHLVTFELQDGTKVAFDFEGEGILVREGQNYAVSGGENLWAYVRELQENYLREQSAGDDWHAISLDDKEEIVQKCPTSAPAGETIQVVVPAVLGAYPHVAVNGDEGFGAFTNAQTYEFVMPDSPVTVRAWLSPDGDPGS